jgi:hypothetical protein
MSDRQTEFLVGKLFRRPVTGCIDDVEDGSHGRSDRAIDFPRADLAFAIRNDLLKAKGGNRQSAYGQTTT